MIMMMMIMMMMLMIRCLFSFKKKKHSGPCQLRKSQLPAVGVNVVTYNVHTRHISTSRRGVFGCLIKINMVLNEKLIN